MPHAEHVGVEKHFSQFGGYFVADLQAKTFQTKNDHNTQDGT